ncbi:MULTISPECIES: GIY-YIG nuclease family protein [Lysobacter]|uniref:GIY-YIG nuclease family protein n=1 Tax=Lysobacter TaxID=68 RepID=UPI001F371EF4|nr:MULTISPECIES: GIY-YIG nuclease family protein [Lysobacter]UJB17808.1 GIY-YIG nuclease family protein [Lysobacter capsici]UJQ28470.1 GIY-YIG nuclease family protein [Lysobacter gummosus]
MSPWFVYVIECRDGSLYTGIAVDVERRYAEHVAGKGARYTRSHPPAQLLARFPHPDRSSALRAEYAIKQLTASAKRALCAGAAVAAAAAQASADAPGEPVQADTASV